MQTTLLLAIATMEQDAGACSPASLEPYAAYPADGSADVAVDSQIVGELRANCYRSHLSQSINPPRAD